MSATLKAIRHAIRDRLLGRIEAVGDAVSTNRADMVWQRHLPAIVIYTKTEKDDRAVQSPPSYDCTAQVVIDVLAQDEDTGLPMDDLIDDLCAAVRRLMYIDPRLSTELPGVVNDAKLISYDVTVADGGERLIAGGRLTWEFVYHEDAEEGDLAELVPFKTAHADYSLDPSATS